MKTVRHILQIKGSQVWTIESNATVYEALRLMADKDIGALLVMDGSHLAGILSERDYARKVILVGKTSKETHVSEIMSTEVHTIHPDQTTQECLELMTKHRIRHLPVIENDQVIGMISLGDAVLDIIYILREEVKVLENKIRTRPG